MRAIVIVRKVGYTLVITIPREMAEKAKLAKGDRVMLSTLPSGGVVVTKEVHDG